MTTENQSLNPQSELPVDEVIEEVQTEEQVEQETAETPQPSKAQKQIERRFARMTKSLAEKEAAIAKMAQEMEALKSNSAAPQQKQVTEASGKPKADDYTTYDEYVDALADWKVEQKLIQREERTREQGRMDAYATRVQEFAKTVPDWQQAIAEVIPTLDRDNDTVQFILESDVGPQILYELANDTDRFNSIMAMSKFKRAAELVRLEQEFVDKKTVKPAAKVAATPRVVPQPATRVTTQSSPSSSAIKPESASFAEWKRWRKESKAGKR